MVRDDENTGMESNRLGIYEVKQLIKEGTEGLD